MDDSQVKQGEFYTTRQAAIILGYSPMYVSRLVVAGHIAAVKPPFTGSRGRWWIPHSEIDRILKTLDQVHPVGSVVIDKPKEAIDKPKEAIAKSWVPRPKKARKPKESIVQVDEPDQVATPKKDKPSSLMEMLFGPQD